MLSILGQNRLLQKLIVKVASIVFFVFPNNLISHAMTPNEKEIAMLFPLIKELQTAILVDQDEVSLWFTKSGKFYLRIGTDIYIVTIKEGIPQ